MKNKLLLIFVISLFLSCTNNDEIQQQTIPKIEKLKPIVFITGIDKGDNKFYTNAKDYFLTKNYIVIENIHSLESIIQWMNTNYTNYFYSDIHIVSHSNSWRGMSLLTSKNGDRINNITLQKYLNNPKTKKLSAKLSENSRVVFHSCGLGNNSDLLNQLKAIFKSNKLPKLYASPYYNVFTNNQEHYLAKTYYVYYPTAHSTGKIDLSKELTRKYTHVNIDWLAALYQYKHSEKSKQTPYTYKFNIPLEWEFEFANKEVIPVLKTADAIMDFVADNEELALELYKLGIPLEKYRWKSKIKANKLVIYGKSTVVCVLQPIMQKDKPNQYEKIELLNNKLYIKI